MEPCKRLNPARTDLEPCLKRDLRDYREFRGYTKPIQRLRFLFLITSRIGILHEAVWRKYDPDNDVVRLAAEPRNQKSATMAAKARLTGYGPG